ncbi:hypothetical protein ASF06_16980 [Agreia sp. Leaf244]|nr:hypothetical protein ASF06_16980 [Agreia sp. Leaf244]
MANGHDAPRASGGEPVTYEAALEALSDVELVYDDGAIQQFMEDGTTVYVESGRSTRGEWSVADDGVFSSYWPPSFRASYSLSWRVENQVVVGLTFTSHRDQSSFSGIFRTPTSGVGLPS